MSCVSTTGDGVGLVAVGHNDGLITVWDLSKHLMLWKTCSLRVDITSITYALATLENSGTAATGIADRKQKENKYKEGTDEKTPEKEQQHDKEVEDNDLLQSRTQQEEAQIASQQQEEDVGHQQTQQEEPQLEDKTQQSQEDTHQENHKEECGQKHQEKDGVQQEDKEQLLKNEVQQKDTESQQEPQQEEEEQPDKLATNQSNDEREQPPGNISDDVTQPVNGTGNASQTSEKSPVVSCRLHSLSIVHSLVSTGKDSSKETSKSASNKDTSSNTVEESSLLTGVSFTRKDGKKDAAIIVYGVPSNYGSENGTNGVAGKSKQKSPYNIVAEQVNDVLLEWDEVPIIPPPPINVDLDTPSWQLAPPTIPAAPPPPPVKGGAPVKKQSGARHLQTFLLSENIDSLPDDASPVISAFQPCGRNQVVAAIEYGPTHGGCLILFNLNNFYDQTIIGESIIYEFKSPLEQIASMCAIEKIDMDSTGSSHCVATINKGGSLIIYNDDTGKLMQTMILTPADSYVSCFSCTNVGLLGVVTKSGKVVTIRVVTGLMMACEPDGDVHGDDINCSSPSLSLHQG